MQWKDLACILVPNSLTYKEKVIILDILPLSFYQELHVIRLFAKLMNDNFDIDWTKCISRYNNGCTTSSQTRNFSGPTRHNECDSNLWFRACQLANLFIEASKEDFLFNPNHRSRLLQVYKAIFGPIDS